jgi:hypothetical protein
VPRWSAERPLPHQPTPKLTRVTVAVGDELRDAVDAADLGTLLAGTRGYLAHTAPCPAAAVDRLLDAFERLTEPTEADRTTPHSVVEGLDRLAQGLAKSH